MFTNISWATYMGFVVILLITWYLIVGLRFYFKDLQMLLSSERKIIFRKAGNETEFMQQDETEVSGLKTEQTEAPGMLNKEEIDNLLYEVEALTVKIKNAVSDAAAKNYNKEEFSFLLQLTLKEYPSLKGTLFQLPINNLIVSECEKQGFIRLSAVELEMLWVEVKR